jgi:hypothetical protein
MEQDETTTQTAFAAPPPDPELRRLEPLVGTWAAEEHTRDTMLGPGLQVISEESFSWLEGEYFLVQTYETTFGDDAAQKGVNYWYFDPEAGRFRIIFFSNNGNYSEEGNRYEGQVAGGRLTFEGPARFQYRLDAEGRIELNGDGTLTVAWWLRDDNGEWSPWMDNTFRNVKR